jgi:Reverse transcriptase (RNA-dependent DNA polymerase)
LEEEPIQPGIKIIPCHWVLVRKPDRFKAHWVIRGNHRVKGVDYNEVCANTAKSGSVQILLALTAAEDLKTALLDTLNAFLNSNIAETVYTIS